MATIVQTTDSNLSTSPVVTLNPGDYFYQLAGVSLTTTDMALPAILATGNGTVDIHGSVFSPGVAIGGPLTAVSLAAGSSVSGGQTGLQTLNNNSANSHYSINGSLTGGTFGFDSSGTSTLYLDVGPQGVVTALSSDGIHLNQTVLATINGTVSGVIGIHGASTTGGFNLAVSQGGRVTGTTGSAVVFDGPGTVVIDGTLTSWAGGIASNSTAGVTITVGTTGSVSAANGGGIGLMSQSATVVVNGSVTGGFDGITNGSSGLGTTNVTVGAAGFVSGSDMGMRIDNNAVVRVAGTVSGSHSWGIQTAISGETGNVYVAEGGLVMGGGGSGALRTRGPHVIENHGTIASVDGVGVLAEWGGYLLNTGLIAGSTVGIVYTNSFDTNAVLTTVNTGTVSGGPNPMIAVGPNFFAYDGIANQGTDRFINQGEVIGDVRLGQHAGSNLINAGLVRGSVYLGNAGQLADSTLGTVTGRMIGGSGKDTLVGGQSGGELLGRGGNDMLYANPTQEAADNHARTSLNGGTGTNALYGGGGWNTFIAGNSNGGYNQVWGGFSAMEGVESFTNNTISFDQTDPTMSVYVDLLTGHNAYINSGQNQSGIYTYEDSIINVPNVVGSSSGDIIICDNGVDRIEGGDGADQLIAGTGPTSQDTFVYTGVTQSNLNLGYDTIAGFKIGIDKIDVSALTSDPGHLQLSNAGLANTVYLLAGSSFNPATDLAISVNATTAGGLTLNDFVF